MAGRCLGVYGTYRGTTVSFVVLLASEAVAADGDDDKRGWAVRDSCDAFCAWNRAPPARPSDCTWSATSLFSAIKNMRGKAVKDGPKLGPYHTGHVKQSTETHLQIQNYRLGTCLLVLHICLSPRQPDLRLQISPRVRSNRRHRQKSNYAGLMRSIAMLMDLKGPVMSRTTNSRLGGRIAMRWLCGPWRTWAKRPLRMSSV